MIKKIFFVLILSMFFMCFHVVYRANAQLDQVHMGDWTIDGDLKAFGFGYGTDTLTTDAQDPGTATATLSKAVTYLISDNTGGAQDEVTLIDGIFEGQIKKFILLEDNEDEGVVVAPTNVTMVGGAGTSTRLQDPGDSVEFTWNSTLGWTLTGNIGATIQ